MVSNEDRELLRWLEPISYAYYRDIPPLKSPAHLHSMWVREQITRIKKEMFREKVRRNGSAS